MAVCKSTGLAPYQILFGQECSTPIDAIFGFVPPERALGNLGWAQYYQQLRKRIGSAQDYAHKHLAIAERRQRQQYHQERKDFKLGTKVWLFTPLSQKNISKKLTPIGLGLGEFVPSPLSTKPWLGSPQTQVGKRAVKGEHM